jgi:hypothetical protein
MHSFKPVDRHMARHAASNLYVTKQEIALSKVIFDLPKEQLNCSFA